MSVRPDRAAREIFKLFLIKPSHYDDDGYVIQWVRSEIPSNTMAAINGIALDCIERRVLGDDVDIEISASDETNTRIQPQYNLGPLNISRIPSRRKWNNAIPASPCSTRTWVRSRGPPSA